jgi:hypothetical protein
MSVTYRLLDTQEADQAVGFWSHVLEMSEDEARRTALEFHDEPGLLAQTYGAISADGELLATVCSWRRRVRDRRSTRSMTARSMAICLSWRARLARRWRTRSRLPPRFSRRWTHTERATSELLRSRESQGARLPQTWDRAPHLAGTCRRAP